MELILIRHLKTPGNEKRQYIGSTDEELSEQEVLNFKQRYKIDSYPQVEQVIVSPMKRCIQTAELIYPKNQITQEVLLKECDFGIFEGKTYEELKDREEYQAWLDSGGTIAFPEGEEQKDGVVVPHPGGQPQGEPKQQIQRPPARPAPARPQHPLHCRAHGCASQQERPPLQQLLPYRQNDHSHSLPTPAPPGSRQAAPPAGRNG